MSIVFRRSRLSGIALDRAGQISGDTMGAMLRRLEVPVVTVGFIWLGLSASSVASRQTKPSPIVPRNSGGATSVISPVVVAQWFTNRRDGVEELELLVLWRGTPGWFLQPGGSGGSGAATGDHHTWLKFGAVDLSLDFDEATRRVMLQGHGVPLAENNVLFVDEVDGPSGPRVVGTMAVSRGMPGSAGQIAPVLRSAPRIMSFLRCNAGDESPRRALFRTLCLQNVGVER